MVYDTSIVVGDYFDNFIANEVAAGRYHSASEVVCEALRLFEIREQKRIKLIEALDEGEKSGIVENFNPKAFKEELLKQSYEKIYHNV